MAEKLKLLTNIPEVIALEWTQGREVESSMYPDSPPQVMFSLCDGRKWFAPKLVAAKVEALQPAKGEALSVCKREGSNKSIFYEVERYKPAPVAQPLSPRSVETSRAEIASQDIPPQNQLTSQLPPDVELYIEALRHARIALYRDQEASRKTPFTIEYGAEDVRAVAACFFIERNKRRAN